jgi:hypothetical protein
MKSGFMQDVNTEIQGTPEGYFMEKCLPTALVTCLMIMMLQTPILASEGNSMISIGNNVVIEEGIEVDRAVSIGGSVSIYGHVKKEAIAVGGSVFLGPVSIVDGDVVSIGGSVVKQEGARVGGKVTVVDTQGLSSMLSWFSRSGLDFLNQISTGIRWISAIGFFIIALLVVAVIPNGVGHVSFQIEHYTLRTFMAGLLGTIIIFPLGFLLLISIVGIVLIPLEIILVGCMVILGYIAVGQLIGKRITIALKKSDQSILLETAIGMAVLCSTALIPFAGWMIKGIAIFLGFGGVIVAVVGRWATK